MVVKTSVLEKCGDMRLYESCQISLCWPVEVAGEGRRVTDKVQ